MDAPIIFCHYGNSAYLPYVLEVSRINNRDKEIFLLGDQENRWISETLSIDHLFYQDYQYGTEIDLFDRVYKVIQGNKHNNIVGGRDWLNFVFKRWFYIYNFLISKGIEEFWHFDSDNMILSSLSSHEPKFRGYDCTEQCNGMCINGFISNPDIVLSYIRKINELFQNERYLQKQQKTYDEVQPTYAFTEMQAYKTFKEEERIRTIRLNTIIDGSTFDDCICQEHNMEMERLPSGRKIKKIFLNVDGRFYCCQKGTNRLLQMNSLNLSWVPLYLFKTVFLHLKKTANSGKFIEPDTRRMPTLSSSIPKKYLVKETMKKAIRLAIKRYNNRAFL